MDITVNILSDEEARVKYDDRESNMELVVGEGKVIELVADNGDVLLLEYVHDFGFFYYLNGVVGHCPAHVFDKCIVSAVYRVGVYKHEYRCFLFYSFILVQRNEVEFTFKPFVGFAAAWDIRFQHFVCFGFYSVYRP